MKTQINVESQTRTRKALDLGRGGYVRTGAQSIKASISSLNVLCVFFLRQGLMLASNSLDNLELLIVLPHSTTQGLKCVFVLGVILQHMPQIWNVGIPISSII